jgi:predicted transcriptional regulator
MLGLPRAGAATLVEFLIVGRNRADYQNRVIQLLTAHKANLISVTSHAANDDHTIFSMSCIVDRSEMNCLPDDLLIAIRKLKFIIRAEKESMSGKIFSNYSFPVAFTRTNNGSVIFEANSLFEILGDCSKIEEHGRKYASRIIDSLRPATTFVRSETRKQARESLVDSVRDYFRASGWGLLNFDFDKADEECDLYNVSTVVISQLPEATVTCANPGMGAPWISFFKGVICGLLEIIAPDVNNKRILGQTFNEQNRSLKFFVARPNQIDPDSIPSERVMPLPQDVNNSLDRLKDKEISFKTEVQAPPMTDFEYTHESKSPSLPTTNSPSAGSHHPSSATANLKANLGSLSMVRKILEAAEKEATGINIIHKVGMRLAEGKKYLDLLQNAGFLEARKMDEQFDIMLYRITSKGIEYLEAYDNLERRFIADYPLRISS